MKIVILDGYTENPGDLSWAQLERYGELTVYDRTPFETSEIIRRIGDAEIVITNKTPIGREVLDACPSVRFVAVLATGYNVVDVKCAREKGIPVSNVPAYGTDAVGQFAIALLLEICSTSPTTPTRCTRAAGRTRRTSASGTIRSSSSATRPWALSASAASGRLPAALPKRWE